MSQLQEQRIIWTIKSLFLSHACLSQKYSTVGSH